MKRPWENDSCATVQACYAVYHVPVAAALWCGVPADEVACELRQATPVGQTTVLGRAVLRHPYLKCLEPRIRAIHAAIDAGQLQPCKEDGRKVADHVAYERRHVYGLDLKEWAKSLGPTERPAFLFDEIERKTHAAINADAFRALQVDRDAARAELDKARASAADTIREMDAMRGERDSLRAMVEKMNAPGERAETTYLNIIGAMLALMLGKSPAGKPQSVFDNQAAIIAALLGHHEGKPGISARTLEEKFAAGKRSLTAT